MASGITDGEQGCVPPLGRLNAKRAPCSLAFRYLAFFRFLVGFCF